MTSACAPGPTNERSNSPTSWGTVIVGKVAVSTWCGTRRRISSTSGAGTPRAGVPARTMPAPSTRTDTAASAIRPAPRRPRAPALSPVARRVAKRRTSSAAERGSGTIRSSSGRAAHTSTRPESSPTLVHHSLVWGAISSVLAMATSSPNATRPTRPGRHGLGVRDHEEEEDQDLGRGHDRPPEVGPADGRERPVGDHAVARACEHSGARGQRQPERGRHGQQMQPTRDQQAAADDHDVGRDHRGVERRPPEVERLHPPAPEHEERHDQPDVRGVEDVGAAVLDDVLREQRQARDDREDVPVAGVPGLVLWRPDDAQDQGHAAAGEHRARRPDERATLTESDRDLEDRAGQDRREDLGHADLEVQADLAEDVDRDDHGRDVQARIADARQEQRIARAAQRERATGGGHRVTRRTWSAGTSPSSVAVPSAHSTRTRSAVGAVSRPKYASRGGPAR